MVKGIRNARRRREGRGKRRFHRRHSPVAALLEVSPIAIQTAGRGHWPSRMHFASGIWLNFLILSMHVYLVR